MCRAGDRGGRGGFVAVVKIESQVARHALVELRRALLERIGPVHHRDAVEVFDLDQLERVLRGRGGGRDDQRDLLPDVAHAIAREDRALRHLERNAAAPGSLQLRRRRLQMLHVRAGEDRDHAGRRARHLHVDGPELGVGAIGAQERRMELAGKIPVGGVAARAFQQARVFAAARKALAHAAKRRSSSASSSLSVILRPMLTSPPL